MGLINVSHSQMTQSVIDLQADLLKNPFYLFSDKKALPVDYYNVNKEQTTLDNGLKLSYLEGHEDSSFRYNRIHNFYLYGLSRMEVAWAQSDFGISGQDISGEAIIPPDTITPYPGDNFVVTMIKQRAQFTVTSVSTDTFDNGGNYWKIEFTSKHVNDEALEPLVVNEYQFVSGNVGTAFSPLILQSKWDACKNLDDMAVALKKLFKGLYFNNKVQTYTFIHLYHVCRSNMNSAYFYDPYMIEFCIKHKVLANSGEHYDFIDHKTNLRPEFGIKYSRSIWKAIEVRDKNELPACKSSSAAKYIDDLGTIFSTRYENYFELTYEDPDPVAEMFSPSVDIIDKQIIGHILENQLFKSDTKYGKYNLLIKYFNGDDNITIDDIRPLEHIIETDNNMENYFLLPMLIYVIEFYIRNMMAIHPQLYSK